MIASHTLTVPEVATQLPLWLKQTKQKRHPLWLTTVQDSKPVAVVIAAEEYEQSQQRLSRLYQWQILHLKQWLDWVERFWDNEQIREECVKVWQENMWQLWEVAPKSVNEFLAGLTLSAKKIDPSTLSKAQVAALRYALNAVYDGHPDEALIEEAHQRLIDSGIAPMLSFDNELVQLYIDEL